MILEFSGSSWTYNINFNININILWASIPTKALKHLYVDFCVEYKKVIEPVSCTYTTTDGRF